MTLPNVRKRTAKKEVFPVHVPLPGAGLHQSNDLLGDLPSMLSKQRRPAMADGRKASVLSPSGQLRHKLTFIANHHRSLKLAAVATSTQERAEGNLDETLDNSQGRCPVLR
jgi:hypothetical protein